MDLSRGESLLVQAFLFLLEKGWQESSVQIKKMIDISQDVQAINRYHLTSFLPKADSRYI